LTAFSGRGELTDLLNRLAAGSPVKLELKRGDKTENLTIKLAALPDSVPEQIPAGGSAKQALMPQMPANPMPKKEAAEPAEPKKEQKPAETGLLQRVNVALGQEYWVYVPPNYDPNIRHALVLWLHPAGKAKEANDFIDIWKEACAERHLIIVGPRTANSTGWVASETDFILAALKDVTEQYTIDRQRIVAHGMANGGQMATYLGFRAREVIRGVATTGAALTSAPKENVPNARLSFYIVGGGKDPLVKEIAGAKPQLQERKFPVIYREIATMGKEYLDLPTFQELIRWIDTLDQL
jgi:acetyl esterase/lipase